MMDWKGHSWIALAVRLYLGGVFLFACWHKIVHPASFATDVATYQLLPLWAVNIFALVLPWLELVCGVTLVLGLRVRASAALIAAMMLSFMIALGWALHMQLDMSCGCFASQGAHHDPISWKTMLRDGVWLLMAVYVFVFDHRAIGLDRWLDRSTAA